MTGGEAPAAGNTVSVIVPCYNEAAVIGETLERLRAVAASLPGWRFEWIFVDDGSKDATPAILAAAAANDPAVKLLSLARNYGHQRALTAGLDHCTGDCAIILDADLQDPPELIPRMLEALAQGADVVHMVRVDRSVDSLPKRISARIFYAVMRRWVLPGLAENAGDFKGFSRRAVLALRQYRERVRFLRGLCAAAGFNQVSIDYARAGRHAGRSKYPLRAMIRLARDAFFSNSALPLRAGLYLGLATWLLLPIYALYCAAAVIAGSGISQPWTALILGVFLAYAGLILILLGFVGEYLKILVLEVKARPLYLIRAAHNIAPRTGNARDLPGPGPDMLG